MNNIYILFSIITACLWGIQPVIYKYAMTSVSWQTVFALNGILYIIPAIGFILYNRKSIKESLHKVNKKLVALILLSAVCGSLIPNILFLKVMQNHKSFLVTALTFTSPVFTLFFSFLFLKEQVFLMDIIGVLAIVLGVVTLAVTNKNETFIV
jgi:drug/metabolite transporter (DMT)-like permease